MLFWHKQFLKDDKNMHTFSFIVHFSMYIKLLSRISVSKGKKSDLRKIFRQ